MVLDTYQLHTRNIPLGPIYHIAGRRAEQAARRGDIKTAAAWLAIAERHLAIAERIERVAVTRAKQAAEQAEHPHRLKALERRAHFAR